MRHTITALCKTASVPRRTFYNWLREDADFRRAWNSLYEETVQHHLNSVLAAAVHQAVKGNTSAQRLVFEVAGALKTRMEHTGKDGGPIQIEGAREKLAAKLADLATRTEAGKALVRAKRGGSE